MAKRITLGEHKAVRLEGIEIKGERFVSLRQLYNTKKDAEWKPAKQGISIPIENAAKVAKYLTAIAEGDDFKEIELNKE